MYEGSGVKEHLMDRDLARHVVAVTFHSLSLLESVLPVLKKHCGKNEYDEYLKAVGCVSAEMSTEILNRVFKQFPEVEREVEAKIQKFGQYI
jgi:hypothetical protein